MRKERDNRRFIRALARIASYTKETSAKSELNYAKPENQAGCNVGYRHQRGKTQADSAYLQQNMSETGTAQKLNVHIATVYRDIEHLKQVANQFVYSLAKDSLADF